MAGPSWLEEEYHDTKDGTTTGAGANDPGEEEEEDTRHQRSWQDWGGWNDNRWHGGDWH